MTLPPPDHYTADHAHVERNRVRFDPTINLGHILTFVGFVLTIAAAWNSLDKRLTVLEVDRSAQVMRDKQQDDSMQQSMQSVRASQGRIESKLDTLLLQDANRGRGGK